MPYLMVQTNKEVEKQTGQNFMTRASALISEQLGKPEIYVMVSLQPPCPMLFSGSSEPAAYLELKSIGLPDASTGNLSKALCSLTHDMLKIDTNRIYIEFSKSERHMWGWNNTTF